LTAQYRTSIIAAHRRATKRRPFVITVNLDEFPLRQEEAPDGTLSFGFPLHSCVGTAASAAVLFELSPGATLATHTDSAEEILLVLEGEAEAAVGEETGSLRAGELAVVPAMVPHGVRNVGDRPLRVLGFFASSTVVSTFPDAPAPGAPQVFVTGAPVELAVPLEEPSTLSA
jgi:quercetin dioxygenase-like cupin family protein